MEYSLKTTEGKNKLDEIIADIRKTKRMFTIKFVKKSGEPRVINGTVYRKSALAGSTNPNYSANHKEVNFNIFQCYEVQITKEEKTLVEDGDYEPKITGYKSIIKDNICEIKYNKQVYKFTDQTAELKE